MTKEMKEDSVILLCSKATPELEAFDFNSVTSCDGCGTKLVVSQAGLEGAASSGDIEIKEVFVMCYKCALEAEEKDSGVPAEGIKAKVPEEVREAWTRDLNVPREFSDKFANMLEQMPISEMIDEE